MFQVTFGIFWHLLLIKTSNRLKFYLHGALIAMSNHVVCNWYKSSYKIYCISSVNLKFGSGSWAEITTSDLSFSLETCHLMPPLQPTPPYRTPSGPVRWALTLWVGLWRPPAVACQPAVLETCHPRCVTERMIDRDTGVIAPALWPWDKVVPPLQWWMHQRLSIARVSVVCKLTRQTSLYFTRICM